MCPERKSMCVALRVIVNNIAVLNFFLFVYRILLVVVIRKHYCISKVFMRSKRKELHMLFGKRAVG